MPDQTVHCVVERAAKLSEPTRKTSLHEPLAYDNAYAHSMRYRAFNDDGTEADLTGYSVVGAFTPSGHNTIKPLLNGTVSGNVAELILPSACYKHPGRFKFTMNLNKGSVSRSVLWVEGMVERNQTDTIEAPTEVLDVSQVITDAQTATANANAAVDRANSIADSLVNDSVNAITAAGTQQRQSVNDLGDQLKSYLEDHYGETTDKVAAKANRSSVSAVKHAIGADGQLNLTDALNEPAKKMTIHLEPKQDLHGYDKPWVGGAGKNLCPTPATNSGTTNGVTYVVNSDGSITLTGTASHAKGVSFSKPFMVKSGVTYLLSGCPSNGSVSTYRLDLRTNETTLYRPTGAGEVSDTGTGASFTPSEDATIIVATRVAFGYAVPSGGIKFYPMVIPATETDSTYEPYSNICPIEGFDSVEVVSTGKNLFPPNNWANGSINTSGNNFSSDYGIRQVDFHRIDPDTDYTFSASGVSDDCALFVYDKNYNLSVRFQLWSISNGNGHYASFRTPSDAAYYKVSLTGSDYRPDRNMNMQLEYGTTATDYEPYQGNTVNVNLVSSAGSTVYGGTVTVNEDGSGTLVVDMASVTLSGLDASNVAYSTSTKTFYITSTVAPGIAKKDYTAAFTGICDKFEPYPGTPAWSANTKPYIGYGSDLNFRFAIPGKTEVADVLDVLNGTTVTYYLATPVTYQLTATQLQTLLGTNHIWTEGTSIDLDYYADRYAEIDKLYAALPKDTATGNPATFTDGADGLLLEKLEVAIEPKQDLHGYDHPWAGGAGKNKLANNLFTNGSSGGIAYSMNQDGSITCSASTAVSASVRIDIGSMTLASGTYVLSGLVANSTKLNLRLRTNISSGSSEIAVVNGTQPVTFTLNAETTVYAVIIVLPEYTGTNTVYPMICLATETDDTYEPYSNICPISGWDKLNVGNVGKNLLDESALINGYINENGTELSDANYRKTTLLPVINGETYALSMLHNGTSQGKRVHGYDKDGNWLRQLAVISTGTTSVPTLKATSFTIPSDVCYIRIGSIFPSLDIDVQLEYGSVATDYEPYQYKSISIPIQSISGSTVYGGKLVVNRDGTGELVVDRAVTTLADKTFANKQSSVLPAGGFIVVNGFTNWIDTSTVVKSDMLVGTTFDNRGADGVISPLSAAASVNSLAIFTTKTKDEAVAAYKNATICYKLATTTTYPLTAPQITTLLGTNHISCDAGEVTVTYHADPTLFITKKIAQALNA